MRATCSSLSGARGHGACARRSDQALAPRQVAPDNADCRPDAARLLRLLFPWLPACERVALQASMRRGSPTIWMGFGGQ